MESSTRTTPRKTKKKWSKTEWLLLLAPLLLIGGLVILNLAPQVQQDYRERRDYENHRPYAVFFAGYDLTFNPIAFSPDGKYLAAATRGTLPSNNGNHDVEVWNTSSRQQISSWPIAGNHTFVNVLKFVSPNVLDVGLSNLGNLSKIQNIGERRDVRSGKLLSSQIAHVKPEVPPSVLFSVSAFPYNKFSNPRPEKLGDTKLRIKLFTVKTPLKVDDASLAGGEKHFVVQWKAQLYDAQGRKLRQAFALFKYFDHSSNVGVSGCEMEFCSSPDGKTLIIRARTVDFFEKDIKQDTDEWIEAFDTTTGRSLWKRFVTQHNKQNGLLRAIAFSPNSDVTAVLIDKYQNGVSQGGIVELRNTRTGGILRQFDVRPLVGSYTVSLYTQFSPDGRLLAIPQDDRLELWDVSDLH